MTISCEEFRARPGAEVELAERPTTVAPFYKSKKEYTKHLKKHVKGLTSLQRLHSASNCYAVLLILQGMDAAGKDRAIRHVMSGINPQGCEVFSFKQPTAGELEHDFLWRTTRDLPERGTSTDHAPWYVVPADDKKNGRLIVSQILLDTLSELKMAYPTTTTKRHQELESFRAQL